MTMTGQRSCQVIVLSESSPTISLQSITKRALYFPNSQHQSFQSLQLLSHIITPPPKNNKMEQSVESNTSDSGSAHSSDSSEESLGNSVPVPNNAHEALERSLGRMYSDMAGRGFNMTNMEVLSPAGAKGAFGDIPKGKVRKWRTRDPYTAGNVDDASSGGDDDTNTSSMYDDDLPIPSHENYTEWMASFLKDIPSPYKTFPSPPIDNEEDMKQYLKLKDIWELQLDLKRDKLGDYVAKNCTTTGVHGPSAAYDPTDYENLEVTRDVKELFQFITNARTSQIILPELKLKPFLPAFYSAVGDVDAFLKVEQPAVNMKKLGLGTLEEPTLLQSDPTILNLQLIHSMKMTSSKVVPVKTVDNVERNPQMVDKWIKDIADLHSSKPFPSVHYSKPMPDVDSLMQAWDPEMEKLLRDVELPEPDLDCDLETYVDLVCSIVGIPVDKSRIHSLHALFTLFQAFKETRSDDDYNYNCLAFDGCGFAPEDDEGN